MSSIDDEDRIIFTLLKKVESLEAKVEELSAAKIQQPLILSKAELPQALSALITQFDKERISDTTEDHIRKAVDYVVAYYNKVGNR
jgi:hypothetical protein